MRKRGITDVTTEEPGIYDILQFQDEIIHSGRLGGYIIQIPVYGEFNCVFGEVTESGDIALHRDSFCMK
ncbi:MAG: hypothetical protein LIP11_18610 [Clostridiales bacterium]|nr:hypothetical protein [Clostridiales bacterium]